MLAARLRPLPPRPLHRPATDLAHYLDYYNYERVHTGRLTRGRIPADIVYGACKVKTR